MATVLLVEDDDQVRVLAESYLEEQGHEVLSAGTAPGALALLAKSSQLELLFTNVDLKGEIAAGIGLAHEAVNRRPNLKVLHDRTQSDRRHEGAFCQKLGLSLSLREPVVPGKRRRRWRYIWHCPSPSRH